MAVAQASSKVIGLGAGGHAKVLIEILRAMGAVEITGLLDVDPKLWKSRQLGVIVLGSDELLPKLFEDGIRQVFIGVGSTGESNLRRNLFAKGSASRICGHTLHPSKRGDFSIRHFWGRPQRHGRGYRQFSGAHRLERHLEPGWAVRSPSAKAPI